MALEQAPNMVHILLRKLLMSPVHVLWVVISQGRAGPAVSEMETALQLSGSYPSTSEMQIKAHRNVCVFIGARCDLHVT
jgi:hypothetical protein